VRNSYHHGEKFVGGPEGQYHRDRVLVAEAYAVLDEAVAWLLPPRMQVTTLEPFDHASASRARER
jgi:hypothetical protein